MHFNNLTRNLPEKLNGKCIKQFPTFSARSRVRGTLEVYHAYIRDLDASDTSSSNNEQDWDIVAATEANIEAETVSQTNVSLLASL